MKRKLKLSCSLLLCAAVLAGTLFAGCAQTTDYTQEIKEYQEKLESLQAENEQLKEMLAVQETAGENESDQTEAVTETAETETETAETESASEAETEQESPEPESEAVTVTEPVDTVSGVLKKGEVTNILVLGDSIWANDRDETGIAAMVEMYLAKLGYEVKVFNAAVGGTRATIDFDDNEWEYTAGSDNTLGKMLSILGGDTDIELIRDVPAYDVVKEVRENRSQIDLVILAYGMNDFLSQAEKNCSERHWCGYGTALGEGIKAVNRLFDGAKIMVIAPTFASHFPISVYNMGDKALFNYVRVANDVITGYKTLGIDPYNNLGVDPYSADDYLEDGIHLNILGRDLYARAVVSDLIYGEFGQVSGNALPWEAFE